MQRPPSVQGQHPSAPSPVVPPPHPQQQQMSAPYPPQGMRRQGSAGMNMGAPGFPIPPQSPQGSYPHRGSATQFHSMHSPVHQQPQHRNQMPMQHSQMPGGQQRPQHMGMQSRGSQGASSMGSSGGMTSDTRQQYIPTGLNGNWQSDKDMPHRREMIQHMYVIVESLRVCFAL